MRKVAVLGSGAWGTTLGQVMVDSGQQVLIWGRNKKVVREINRRHSNRRFLKGIDLPRELKATTDIKAALEFAEVILLAIPAQTLRENLVSWKGFFPAELPVISTLKGIEVETQFRMTEVVQDVLSVDQSRLGIITGPNLASEIIMRQPAGAVAASENQKNIDRITIEQSSDRNLKSKLNFLKLNKNITKNPIFKFHQFSKFNFININNKKQNNFTSKKFKKKF